jgi:hypothetical protein
LSLVFLAALRGISAGAALLTRGLQVRFNGEGQIFLPTIAQGQAGFVGQGKPIPVAQFASASGVSLTPHKLALISSLTREMVESSSVDDIVYLLAGANGPLTIEPRRRYTRSDA